MATLYDWFEAGLELIECLWLLNVFIIFVTTATLEVGGPQRCLPRGFPGKTPHPEAN